MTSFWDTLGKPEEPKLLSKSEERKLKSQALHLAEGFVVDDRWKIGQKLGEGGFGIVYQVEDQRNGKQWAMKVEIMNRELLVMEMAVLMSCSKSTHVAEFMDCGKILPNKNYLVMQLFGTNLSAKRRGLPGRKASACTTLKVGLQACVALKDLHRGGFIHRDVKPSNFVLGEKGSVYDNVIFIVDFGLCRQFIKPDGKMRTWRQVTGFRGTARYASPNAHALRDVGRQDDLWSLVYMLVEYVTGDLPWKRRLDKQSVANLKQSVSLPDLTADCPPCFLTILKSLERLNYHSLPEYNSICAWMREDLKDSGQNEQQPFDWQNNLSPVNRLPEDQARVSTFAEKPDPGDIDRTI